jgi:hypothetical protein
MFTKMIKESLLKDEKFIESLTLKMVNDVNRNLFFDTFMAQEAECIATNNYDNIQYIMNIFMKMFIEKVKNNPKLLHSFLEFVIDSSLLNDEGKKVLLQCFDKLEETIIDHKKNSKEPWVNITGDIYDEETGKLKIALDWNDAFIRLLQKQGVTGEDEDEIVEQWLKGLANQ